MKNKLPESISIDLFTKFNEVKFYDEPHKYYIDNQELISVTTLIHQYQNSFDENYWADFKAQQFDLPVYKIKRAWDFINKKGTMKGSIIHDYAENLFYNKVFEYPERKIINEFGFDPIIKEYEITKNHVDKFWTDTKDRLIPIKMELVVYDKESLIGGMLDCLFYNVRAKELQIWDNKTNKQFSFNNERGDKLTGCLSTLEDCDIEIYSLQLEFYKQIIQRNTNLKLGKSFVVWFSHNNPSYEVIETKNREFYINKLINDRINELAI